MQSKLIQISHTSSSRDLIQHKTLRNTYWLLAISMIPTLFGALIGTHLTFTFFAAYPFLSTILFFVGFYGLMGLIQKHQDSTLGIGLLLLFTFLMGIMLGPILQFTFARQGGMQLVLMAAGGTAIIFFVLASIGSVAKRDFSFLNHFLMVGAIVLIIAMLANLFLNIPALSLTICAAFLLFSSAAILFQINQIVRGGETNYIRATLYLYVNLYNLFTSLLRLLRL